MTLYRKLSQKWGVGALYGVGGLSREYGTSVVSSSNDQLARHPAFVEDDLELLVMQKKVSFRYCCHNHRDTINGKISVVNMAFHINVQSCKDILKSACTVQVQPIVKLKKSFTFMVPKFKN